LAQDYYSFLQKSALRADSLDIEKFRMATEAENTLSEVYLETFRQKMK
jgi:hypothetical protein